MAVPLLSLLMSLANPMTLTAFDNPCYSGIPGYSCKGCLSCRSGLLCYQLAMWASNAIPGLFYQHCPTV
jgi:hypothetical protein